MRQEERAFQRRRADAINRHLQPSFHLVFTQNETMIFLLLSYFFCLERWYRCCDTRTTFARRRSASSNNDRQRRRRAATAVAAIVVVDSSQRCWHWRSSSCSGKIIIVFIFQWNSILKFIFPVSLLQKHYTSETNGFSVRISRFVLFFFVFVRNAVDDTMVKNFLFVIDLCLILYILIYYFRNDLLMLYWFDWLLVLFWKQGQLQLQLQLQLLLTIMLLMRNCWCLIIPNCNSILTTTTNNHHRHHQNHRRLMIRRRFCQILSMNSVPIYC